MVIGMKYSDYSTVFLVQSTVEQSKFGSSINIHKGYNLLAVGAPSWRSASLSNSGAVYLFDLTISPDFNHPKAIIFGEQNFMRFGKRLLWVNNNLVVSAPSHTGLSTHISFSSEQGSVFVIQDAIYTYGNNNLSQLTSRQYTTNWVNNCRHGDAIAYSAKAHVFAVGSPYCGGKN